MITCCNEKKICNTHKYKRLEATKFKVLVGILMLRQTTNKKNKKKKKNSANTRVFFFCFGNGKKRRSFLG